MPALPGVPYQPVSTVHVIDGRGLVQILDSAPADHVRRAIAAGVAELATMVEERSWPTPRRTDATTMLAEGSRETRLSPRDVGRIAELRVVARDLAANPALTADAALLVLAMGLVERPSAPHLLPGNEPVVGSAAVDARLAAIAAQLGGDLAPIQAALDAAASPGGQATITAEREAQAARRAELRDWAQQAAAARDDADLAVTARVDAALHANPGHVFDRLIIGGGWAATADFVSLGAPADTGDGVPPVLAVSLGNDPWSGRGELLMGQVPNELEIDGFPFQAADFAEDPTGFARSSDFAAAVGAARATSGMPTYQGRATSIEPRPEPAAGWPDGAQYLVTVDGRAFFAATIDVVSGPGPARIPTSSTPAGQRFTDPATGVSVDHSTTPPTCTDYTGMALDPRTLPEQVQRVLGYNPVSGAFGAPQLADQQGRLTNPWVLDPVSGLRVDPSTGQVSDQDGRPVDPASLDFGTQQRLGFAPDGSYGDPRYVRHESGYAIHPVSGDIVAMSTGQLVDPSALDAATRTALDDAVRSRRAQFGGENTSDRYQPGDRVLIYGAGASGAWDTEQAQRTTPHVDWVARTAVRTSYDGNPHLSALLAELNTTTDPVRQAELTHELSFGGGYNRRNTVPDLGAYGQAVPTPANQSLRNPVSVQSTVDGSFAVVFDDGSSGIYDRVVFSIGQDETEIGGVAALLGGTSLRPLQGPGGEINGLQDASADLRVLGAASVPTEPRGRRLPRRSGDAVGDQARALPTDSRGIAAEHPASRAAYRRGESALGPASSAVPDQDQEQLAEPLPRSLHFDTSPRSGADLPAQVRQLVDAARARLTAQAPPSVRLDARLAALAAIGEYANMLDTLAAAATATVTSARWSTQSRS